MVEGWYIEGVGSGGDNCGIVEGFGNGVGEFVGFIDVIIY